MRKLKSAHFRTKSKGVADKIQAFLRPWDRLLNKSPTVKVIGLSLGVANALFYIRQWRKESSVVIENGRLKLKLQSMSKSKEALMAELKQLRIQMMKTDAGKLELVTASNHYSNEIAFAIFHLYGLLVASIEATKGKVDSLPSDVASALKSVLALHIPGGVEIKKKISVNGSTTVDIYRGEIPKGIASDFVKSLLSSSSSVGSGSVHRFGYQLSRFGTIGSSLSFRRGRVHSYAFQNTPLSPSFVEELVSVWFNTIPNEPSIGFLEILPSTSNYFNFLTSLVPPVLPIIPHGITESPPIILELLRQFQMAGLLVPKSIFEAVKGSPPPSASTSF